MIIMPRISRHPTHRVNSIGRSISRTRHASHTRRIGATSSARGSIGHHRIPTTSTMNRSIPAHSSVIRGSMTSRRHTMSRNRSGSYLRTPYKVYGYRSSFGIESFAGICAIIMFLGIFLFIFGTLLNVIITQMSGLNRIIFGVPVAFFALVMLVPIIMIIRRKARRDNERVVYGAQSSGVISHAPKYSTEGAVTAQQRDYSNMYPENYNIANKNKSSAGDGYIYCDNCGAKQKASNKFCENCGSPLYH